MMRKAFGLFAALALWPQSQAMAGPPIVRVLERVQPVCTVQAQTGAVVLVEVVDDHAAPMEGIVVTMTTRGKRAKPVQVVTDRAGRARFTLAVGGDVRVDANHVGFATSRAAGLRVKPGCLTAVMLPMQVVSPTEIISQRHQPRGMDRLDQAKPRATRRLSAHEVRRVVRAAAARVLRMLRIGAQGARP